MHLANCPPRLFLVNTPIRVPCLPLYPVVLYKVFISLPAIAGSVDVIALLQERDQCVGPSHVLGFSRRTTLEDER